MTLQKQNVREMRVELLAQRNNMGLSWIQTHTDTGKVIGRLQIRLC